MPPVLFVVWMSDADGTVLSTVTEAEAFVELLCPSVAATEYDFDPAVSGLSAVSDDER